jgi:ABC-2 type transport system ATP-binding protein
MTTAIATQGLTRTFGAVTAVASLDLEVEEGEIFGLLGHNGAGKTTTVNMLTTLLPPTGGQASICGRSITADAQGVRRLIGYLPENVRFYDSLTLLENLRFFAELSGLRRPEPRIREVLRILDFERPEDQRVGTYSKGMRQRVGIAQAILHEPRVLFLDEPTSGLDPEGVRTLRETIIRLNSEFGMTVFMNTHLLSEVTKTCRSIGILREGRLIHHAPLADTLAAFPDEDSLEEVYFKLEAKSRP